MSLNLSFALAYTVGCFASLVISSSKHCCLGCHV
uniref:Uncharacterized protein n=1 Tax=Arundo donax TaxID=35708 RepID=A0A0A9G557_ARUDO